MCQNCAVVDPNTGFEFNLQLLASENGYQKTANGKVFLVRRALEGDRRFPSSSLHLCFLINLQVNICSDVKKCGAGIAGCVLEDGVPVSQVGIEKSLQYSTNGLLTLKYKGKLDKPTGISTGTQHSSFCSCSSACSFRKCWSLTNAVMLPSYCSRVNVIFLLHQQNGTLSPLILSAIQTLTPAH